MSRGSVWTDDMLATTERLWSEGKSASEIARALSRVTPNPITRNAVIGIVHRRGWHRPEGIGCAPRTRADDSRPVYRRTATKPRPVVAARVEAPPKRPAPAVAPPVPRIAETPYAGPRSILDGRSLSECPYIVQGTGEAALMCCRPVERGYYCRAHAKRCYQPQTSSDKTTKSAAKADFYPGVRRAA
jgi:GcrA cell cycle regulator